MISYYELGSVPIEEDCVQVDRVNEYVKDMTRECTVYLNMLKNKYPNIEQFKCNLRIKNFNHSFGQYKEVVVYYDKEIPESEEVALDICNNIPLKWTTDALEEFKRIQDKKEAV